MLSVLKVGGSVLRDDASYAIVASFLRRRLAGDLDERLVVIVSARHGSTDALLAEAEAILADPAASEGRREPPRSGGPSAQPGGESKGAPPSEVNNDALDLLWSTGELRSVALLALHLQRIGVTAVPFNVHQAGLVAERSRNNFPDLLSSSSDSGTTVRPLRLLAALATSRIVIVPGFLGVSAGGTITSLGRGGSDLTAVLLAAAVRADACELIKDVPGYFTADPHRDADAQPLHDLSVDEALCMADKGCDLVQRAALVAAAHAGLHLTIRSMDAAAPVTHVHSRSHHGVRHEDHSRRSAVGA